MIMAATSCKAQDTIHLPKPSLDNKVTLMQALQNRHSTREYADKQIPDDVLSTVLWAACGINRASEGRITAPSAINAQDIQVYVVRECPTRQRRAWALLTLAMSVKISASPAVRLG